VFINQELQPGIEFNDIDELEIARQMTLINFDLYAKIEVRKPLIIKASRLNCLIFHGANQSISICVQISWHLSQDLIPSHRLCVRTF
jgi:hypothetical protein